MSPGLPERLARGERISEPVTLVIAHPDDETLGLGSRLRLFDRLTLIHLTDGAPHDPADARAAGFATREAYAAARRAELDAALAVLEARPARRLAYGLPDQVLINHLPELALRLSADLEGCAAVGTHAYEGGHPDHDTAALAVALSCGKLGAEAPERFEFAGYFGVDDVLRTNSFHVDPAAPEFEIVLTDEERARKARAFLAFGSQSDILANFPPGVERLRRAPVYDFKQPPPPGETHYDRYGWGVAGAGWRKAAEFASHRPVIPLPQAEGKTGVTPPRAPPRTAAPRSG